MSRSFPRPALTKFDENIFVGLLFLEVDVKIGIFPILTAYRLGFGIFIQNPNNPDGIGMVGQSD